MTDPWTKPDAQACPRGIEAPETALPMLLFAGARVLLVVANGYARCDFSTVQRDALLRRSTPRINAQLAAHFICAN